MNITRRATALALGTMVGAAGIFAAAPAMAADHTDSSSELVAITDSAFGDLGTNDADATDFDATGLDGFAGAETGAEAQTPVTFGPLGGEDPGEISETIITVSPLAPWLGVDGLPALPTVEGIYYVLTQFSDTGWYVNAYAEDGYEIAAGAQTEWIIDSSLVEEVPVVTPEGGSTEIPAPAEEAAAETAAPAGNSVTAEAPKTQRAAATLAHTGGEASLGGVAAAILALGAGIGILARRRGGSAA